MSDLETKAAVARLEVELDRVSAIANVGLTYSRIIIQSLVNKGIMSKDEAMILINSVSDLAKEAATGQAALQGALKEALSIVQSDLQTIEKMR